ncbi:high-affinity zinc uptake system binding-protein ZnuA [Clostridiales bacterium]|nr:high-affinity zinc uptake system binding-protein ZnuA [Clostridiales bacterium]
MKIIKKFTALVAAFMLLTSCRSASVNDSGINIVASFYPIYLIAENVIGNTDVISLSSMAGPQTGCLHDYQLTAGDMERLERADVFIINGGGMESFLDNAINIYPSLNVIDSSLNVMCLHEHEDHEFHAGHDHGENSHYWILPQNAVIQAWNICDELSLIYPQMADEFSKNTREFERSINSIDSLDCGGIKACVFSEAFEYLSPAFNIDVEACIDMDESHSPSAKELANIIDLVNEEKISLLIASDDASKSIADVISAETDASVIVLDPILGGDFSPEGYVSAMSENVRILKGCVENERS